MSSAYAALFPGQAVLEAGAATGLLDDPLLALAGELAGVDVRRLLRRGGPQLDRTEVLQPLVTALSLAAFARLPACFAVVAGHSLGMVAAWAAAGGISAEQAVRLAHARAQAMAEQARRFPGGLVATASEQPPPGTVLALRNAPDEYVFAGPDAALVGLRRLRVAGPWHHPHMAGAAPALSRALADLDPEPLRVPLVDDQGVLHSDGIGDLLLAQLSRPLDWPAVCARLTALPIAGAVVLPPSRVLARHTAACAPPLSLLRCDPPAALARTLEQLSCAPSPPT